MQRDIDAIRPRKAVELYKESRRTEVSEATLSAHGYRLSHFIRWCEGEGGFENMNDLTGRSLYEYRIWRREDGDLNPVTLQTQLSTLRVFIKFCESIDAVGEDLSEKIVLPTLKDGEGERTAVLSEERAERIFGYLNRIEYATRDHALLEVLWFCGLRVGEARALDVGDYHADKQRLAVRHRPEGGTSLKNGHGGERLVALNERVCEVLEDYLQYHRSKVGDSSSHESTPQGESRSVTVEGRKPLFSTSKGRCGTTTLRNAVYRLTQPCLTGDCPVGRNPEDCDDKGRSACPETLSPHDVRRGAITHFLSEDVPEKVVSDRMDVSSDVLEKHYDQRSEEGKMEQRRQYLSDV